MTKTELKELGEEVRKQGRGAHPLTNLVYDMETGEFVCVRGDLPVPAAGTVVTEMTRQGFAAHE